VPIEKDGLQIEFNPNRPPARVRYSLAHEIAHTLFPDCRDQIRNRSATHEITGDEWQLEALCNIAAAEFLMPAGSLPHLHGEALSIDSLMELRKQFQVSAEALLIRVAKLSDDPCAAFCATRIESGNSAGRYRLDYSIPSATWGGHLQRGRLLPADSHVRECTAIGYTAKAAEDWAGVVGDVYIECVGISPYPGASFPRVVGVLRAEHLSSREQVFTELVGDATDPRGAGAKMIVHIVNDRTPRWGGRGFAAAVARKWKHVQEEFVEWATSERGRLRLGTVHQVELQPELTLVHMIAQHGYGPSATPRIRYSALRTCLEEVTRQAKHRGASVHMPRIGAGEAGGNWQLVEEIISSTLGAAGVPVFVYDLPNAARPQQPQIGLEFAN
jgi:O-acetyl-ADP-ribose deacetylase (regulator of RNase III)